MAGGGGEPSGQVNVHALHQLDVKDCSKEVVGFGCGGSRMEVIVGMGCGWMVLAFGGLNVLTSSVLVTLGGDDAFGEVLGYQFGCESRPS